MSAAWPAWASIRAQRSARTARLVRLMRDARGAVAGEHAHAVARLERLVGVLHDGEVLSGIQQHGHFDAGALVRGALHVGADEAAQERACDGADELSAAPAHVASGDHAERRATRGADAGF